MHTFNQVKEALTAKSRTATLDELTHQGRKTVRVIKAEHVAGMIALAVDKAMEESGCVTREQADQLVERGREEFQGLMQQRQQELHRLADLEELLRMRDAENAELRAALEQAESGAAAARAEDAPAAARAEDDATTAVGPTQEGVENEVSEELASALDRLAGSLNERIEKLGQKMGVSSAVEGEEVNLDGLFDEADTGLESNMDNIQVKNKAGGSIADNLARLKKLKGGG